MELFDFDTVYTHIREFYGIELNPDDFETKALMGYSKIGNNVVVTKKTIVPIIDHIVILPCDVSKIEAVYSSLAEHQETSNMSSNPWTNNANIETYIESRKYDTDYLYTAGEFVKYETIANDKIKVFRKDGNVIILYKTNLVDTEGLPFLNIKEVDAIAAYCAYADTFKKALMTRDQSTVQLSQMLKQEWLRLCDQARTPMSLSQNDFDEIGDVRYSWDRKTYGKSFKPIK